MAIIQRHQKNWAKFVSVEELRIQNYSWPKRPFFGFPLNILLKTLCWLTRQKYSFLKDYTYIKHQKYIAFKKKTTSY